ncbi:MAG TPA: carboxymuconolactone decarboxylase family protein [Candidatus Binataceae bacterium]|nr:carboxymuconolactone decarboxylase family protein [Candidatus Binataceae bacterium]
MIPLLPVDEAVKRGKEVGLDERFSSLNAFRGMLHSPRAAGAAAELLRTLMFRNTLNPRSRELVILRNGWRTASEYEFCQHVRVARDLKLSEAEILGVRDPDKCDAYNETDRAVLRMADELLDKSEVSAKTWATLEKAFPPGELVELLLVAGFWRMIAGYLKSAKVPLDSDVPSWPEGRAPA